MSSFDGYADKSQITMDARGAFKGERQQAPNQGRVQQFKLRRPSIVYDNMKVTVTSKDGKFKGEMSMTGELAALFGSDTVIYIDGLPRSDGTLGIMKFLDNQLW